MALNRSNSSKLMWIIVGGLVAIFSLAVLFLWYTALPKPIPQDSAFTTPEISQAKAPAQQAVAEVVEPAIEDITAVDTAVLVKHDILQEKVPQNATLAHEEIAKLDDIQKQLEQQLETIEAQQADADQLIQLKEEQIKLLEQQLSAHNQT